MKLVQFTRILQLCQKGKLVQVPARKQTAEQLQERKGRAAGVVAAEDLVTGGSSEHSLGIVVNTHSSKVYKKELSPYRYI